MEDRTKILVAYEHICAVPAPKKEASANVAPTRISLCFKTDYALPDALECPSCKRPIMKGKVVIGIMEKTLAESEK